MLAAGPELLPLVIEPPQPPAEPSGGAFEEGAAQPGVALEDSAGGHASDGPHQLDWIANGMGDRVEVGVPDEAPPGIVLERGVAGRMKSDRHVELLERGPQRLARLVVQMLAVDRVRGADDGDGAKLPDASARLFDRRRDAVHRHDWHAGCRERSRLLRKSRRCSSMLTSSFTQRRGGSSRADRRSPPPSPPPGRGPSAPAVLPCTSSRT